MNVKSKEATEIINSLISGTVPRIGIQHIAVGRDEEIQAMLRTLEDVKTDIMPSNFGLGNLDLESLSCFT